jgi:hypothetical protein
MFSAMPACSRCHCPSRSAPSLDGDHIGLDKFSERLNFERLQVLIWAGRGRPAMYTSHLSPGFGRGSFGHKASRWGRTRPAQGRWAPGGWCVGGCRPSPSRWPGSMSPEPGRSTAQLLPVSVPASDAGLVHGAAANTRSDGKTGMADWRSSPNTQDWRPRLHNRERIRSLARRRMWDSSYGSIRGGPKPGATDAPKPAPRCKERPPWPEQGPGRQPGTSISSCTPWASNKFSQRPETEPRRGKERLTPCQVFAAASRHCDDCIGRWRAGISRHARARKPRTVDPRMSAPRKPGVAVELHSNGLN